MNIRVGILVTALALVVLVLPHTAAAQRAVVVVRHADKLNDSVDSPLNEAGGQRARKLADMLRDANVKEIFCTEFQRTQKTAEPLAKKLNIPAVAWNREDISGLVERIRTYKDDVVLVVAHSHTVPSILKALGDSENVVIGNEFDNLFVVVPRSGLPPTVLHLRY